MARVTIAVDSEAKTQVVETTFDAVVFRLAIRWNDALGQYVLDLRDSADSVLLAGKPLVVNQDLLAPSRPHSAQTPAGVLMAVDLSGRWEEAAFGDLGGRVVILYEEAT